VSSRRMRVLMAADYADELRDHCAIGWLSAADLSEK
jgi:hypothetical protein